MVSAGSLIVLQAKHWQITKSAILSGAPLSSIPTELFEVAADIHMLDLHDTALPQLPAALTTLVNLRHLNLDRCCLDGLAWPGPLRQLTHLSLQQNRYMSRQTMPQAGMSESDLVRLLQCLSCPHVWHLSPEQVTVRPL